MPVGSTELNKVYILRHDAFCKVQPDIDRVATREPWGHEPADMQKWETLGVPRRRPKACCHYWMHQDKHEVTCVSAHLHSF